MKDIDAYKKGKSFTAKVDCNVYMESGRWLASVSIGEEYYETDRYANKENAVAEAKGYLEGIRMSLGSIDKLLNNSNDGNA